jgi:hypothetical protein
MAALLIVALLVVGVLQSAKAAAIAEPEVATDISSGEADLVGKKTPFRFQFKR